MTPVAAAPYLPLSFFARPTDRVARDLLGAVLTSRVGRRVVSGRIVETEAYLGRDDPASHGYRLRRTPRNAALFEAPGTWYVYLSYGVHWCSNLVCEAAGSGAAVLIRALEPLEGIPLMRRRRGGAVTDRALCSGPGKLCQALAITKRLDGKTMPSAVVTVSLGDVVPQTRILVTPRIGITKAADWPLRFVMAGSPWASTAA